MLINLSHITFEYEDGTPVFQNFSFSLEEGKCVFIVGDNGSGKTTLFRILNGLAFPQEGSYEYSGTTIDRDYLKDNRNSKAFHKNIGYLFQNPDIMLFNARVYDEIAFGPRQMGLSDKEVRERTEDCIALFHLDGLEDKAPYHLSGGQKKRVALASICALNPDLLILDEPLAGLDKKSKEWFADFLRQWKLSGKTLIIASHDEGLREALADEVVQLHSLGEEK